MLKVSSRNGGGNMKKTIIAIFAGLAVILGAVWWFQPRPIVDESFEISSVQVGWEDVTEQVDLEALEQVLRKGTCSRFPRNITAFLVTEEAVDICSTGSRTVQFSMTYCAVYDISEQKGYIIHDSDELWGEVLALMPE